MFCTIKKNSEMLHLINVKTLYYFFLNYVQLRHGNQELLISLGK